MLFTQQNIHSYFKENKHFFNILKVLRDLRNEC